MVKTKLGPSEIEGIGLFADQDIKKGDVVWKEDDGLSYLVFTEEQWRKMEKEFSPETFRQIKRYSFKYKATGNYELLLDDTRHMNHSDNSNTIVLGENGEGDDIAARDIKKGEEITCNYKSFYAPDYFEEIINFK
ncbi:MAG: SET domain-containing protein [Candidatus Pacebacteria bacterium]|nr:SET domain-containing protein [Candidatus Paceibacterota bacterium]